MNRVPVELVKKRSPHTNRKRSNSIFFYRDQLWKECEGWWILVFRWMEDGATRLLFVPTSQSWCSDFCRRLWKEVDGTTNSVNQYLNRHWAFGVNSLYNYSRKELHLCLETVPSTEEFIKTLSSQSILTMASSPPNSPVMKYFMYAQNVRICTKLLSELINLILIGFYSSIFPGWSQHVYGK